MKTHYSVTELLKLELSELPRTKVGLGDKIKRENWQFREVAAKGGRGGVKKEYLPPPEIQAAIIKQHTEQVLAEQAAVPLPALADVQPEKTDLSGSTEAQRTQLGAREAVLNAIETLMSETKVGKDSAITTFLTSAQHPSQEHLLKMLVLATDKRGGGGQVPNARTVKRWFKQREENRLMSKTPQKNWQVPEWFSLFLHYYRQPQKPTVSAAYRKFVADWLTRQPLAKVPSQDAVRRWLDKTGNVFREDGRMGKRELKNLLPFKRRKFDDLLPCDIYSMDGHTFDAEVLHPDSGKPFRPEITTVIDVATRKIVGWSVDLAESSLAVTAALAHASVVNGIGAVLYVDNGKGYDNALMKDDAVGLMGRLGMTMVHSLPYSSQARGVIERVHQTVWVQAAKEFQSYIGKDMDAETSQKVHKASRKAMKQDIVLKNVPALANIRSLSASLIPDWREFVAFGDEWVGEYNNRPHRSLPKVTDVSGSIRHMTPNEMWALKAQESAITQVDEDDAMYLFMPQAVRKVARGEIQLHNNLYFSQDLQEYHGDELRVAYNIHNADWVWLFDDDGRFVCKAQWNGNRIDYMSKPFIEQAKDKRVDAQVKRLETKISVVEAARPVKVLEHQQSVSLGGLVVDLAQAKRETEAVLLPRAEIQPEPKTVEVLDAEDWRLPSTEAGRWAEWSRLSALSEADLRREPERAQRWLVSYTRTPEFKVMNKKVA
ncbi:Mu transposase C-terminal domain-containing protein [Wielerella bovis]|uniref:Mu transposase C-terminal domain-containing protein n=1 Tax=Wielerella bovis TaxID=2917790 RepID=UPI002019050C|nr:Mu transposase C-terminal domain-containing protein [Wielerella bovis]MCG7655903.1 Mu transposase C-terminal domain-containing protein [Wielerella bovis]MCG7656898.1 Mu transposase C-terminal domain-containing protein [Wielerella bovis]MCG7658093.1 Mu transposase C-terminal domain-containing protein [Wielerella bovis]MCG7658179.1 Mu transposase C-terminal domain-containing protein [Wielerella bovis]MCG7659121.1 Mu transposase C-terminal domain-containing protein [Wielerella bovis]